MVSERVANLIVWAIIIVLFVGVGRLAVFLSNGWSAQG